METVREISFYLSIHPSIHLPIYYLYCYSAVEAKNPALLSNRDGYLLELTGWTQGSQAS